MTFSIAVGGRVRTLRKRWRRLKGSGEGNHVYEEDKNDYEENNDEKGEEGEDYEEEDDEYQENNDDEGEEYEDYEEDKDGKGGENVSCKVVRH